MSNVIVRSFDAPDEVWELPGGARMELVTVDGLTVGRGTAPPGWRSEQCELRHVGIVLSGREAVRMADGTEVELKAGDAFVIEPGHESWVVGDAPCVSLDFLAPS